VIAKPVTYSHDENGQALPSFEAPFDGALYLVRTTHGWVQAWWNSSRDMGFQSGNEYSGFEWVCADGKFTAGLGEVEFWTELPEIK